MTLLARCLLEASLGYTEKLYLMHTISSWVYLSGEGDYQGMFIPKTKITTKITISAGLLTSL